MNLLTHLHKDFELFEIGLATDHKAKSDRGVQFRVVDPFSSRFVVAHVRAAHLVIGRRIQRVVWV